MLSVQLIFLLLISYVSQYSSRSRRLLSRPSFEWKVVSKGSSINATIRFRKTSQGYNATIAIDLPCNASKPFSYFDDYKAQLLVDRGIGPDEVIIQLEGASLQTKIGLVTSYEYCRSYSALFQIPIWGKYRLKIFRLRSDYGAVKEFDGHPHIFYDEFLDESVGELPYYAPQPCSSEIDGNFSIFRLVSLNCVFISELLDYHDLPLRLLGYCRGGPHSAPARSHQSNVPKKQLVSTQIKNQSSNNISYVLPFTN